MLRKRVLSLALLGGVALGACDRNATGVERTGEETNPNSMIIGPGGPQGPGRPGGDPPQPNSPHWTHARFATTAWAIAPSHGELEHVSRHYDLVMSGPLSLFHQLNPTGTYMPYTLLWHLPLPQHGSPSLDSFFYQDMQQWYADPSRNTGGWSLENAFLHSQHPRTEANRLLTPVVPGNFWWQNRRWVMNPTDPGYRAYTIDRYNRLLAASHHNAIFIDEHAWEIGLMDGSVEHTYASVRNGIAAFYAAIRPGLNNAMLMFNTANYHPGQFGSWILDAARNAGGVHHESLFNAFVEFPNVMDNLRLFAETGAVLKPTSNIDRDTYNNAPGTFGVEFPRGNHATPGDRGKMVELAMYYMALTTPERMYYSPGLSGSFVESWYPPYQRNVGSPTGAASLYASGVDGVGQAGQVYGRSFSNALVLLRPVTGWMPNPNYGNGSVMTVMLPPGNWYRVLDNNLLDGRASQSVQLRLAEAAIFIRVN